MLVAGSMLAASGAAAHGGGTARGPGMPRGRRQPLGMSHRLGPGHGRRRAVRAERVAACGHRVAWIPGEWCRWPSARIGTVPEPKVSWSFFGRLVPAAEQGLRGRGGRAAAGRAPASGHSPARRLARRTTILVSLGQHPWGEHHAADPAAW